MAAAAGLAVVAVTLVPFALAGTLGTAVVHVARILHQERLSGGYANVWWAVGGLLRGAGGTVVPYVRLDDVAFPARLVGTFALLAAIVLVCRALAHAPRPHAVAAAAGALVAAYGALAVGVHVNHTHGMVLLLLASGRRCPGWRGPAWILVSGYAANLVLLEGLGRLDSGRYAVLGGVNEAFERARLGLGFDLTLPLAAAHAAALAVLLLRARTALGGGWEADGMAATAEGGGKGVMLES
jgi:hypothetical protein